MIDLVQTAAVVGLTVAGCLIGRRIARVQGRLWALGFALPLAVVLLIAVARRVPRAAFVPPFAWIMAGRFEFALLGPLCGVLFGTPAWRSPNARLRALAITFGAVVAVWCSILPFLEPLLIRSRLLGLETNVSSDGVCLQSTSYTCGPAAAVTALGMLGLRAEEGELAVLAYTSSVAGTPPDLLCTALQQRYGEAGISAEYRCFEGIDGLPERGVVLAEAKFGFLTDHWVVILGLTETGVLIGDPLFGQRNLSREAFARGWRHRGIVVRRH
ncbi:cysteine peptidase family C39 domain-containing protein [Planctomycetota bacterium]